MSPKREDWFPTEPMSRYPTADGIEVTLRKESSNIEADYWTERWYEDTRTMKERHCMIEFHMLEGEYFEIESRYSKTLVEIYKEIPGSDRYWDKGRLRWGFLKKWEPIIKLKIKEKLYEDITYAPLNEFNLDKTMMEQKLIITKAKQQARGELVKQHINPKDIRT